jgi:hypothetical protein
MKTFVFIMTRHINSEQTNNYWIESYKCIRNFYPETKIVIIDDNSDINFINDFGMTFNNVEFVKSEYPKRGELLPYYYFYKNKYADNAIIIHDSIFIQKKIDFESMDDNIKFLWHHCHDWNDEVNEKRLIKFLNHSDTLLELYDNKSNWCMCFGVMSFISHDFLTKIQDTLNFFNLINHIVTRSDRMFLERIFGLVCIYLEPKLNNDPSIFGIHPIGRCYEKYKQEKIENSELPAFAKIHSGR